MIITVFVLALLGVIFLGILADQIVSTYQTYTKTNESITITGGSGKTANSPLLSVSFFGNGTNNTDLGGGGYAIGEDINSSRNGSIKVATNILFTGFTAGNGTFFADGTYNITYTYANDNYLQDRSSTSVNILKPTIILFAVGVLLVVIGLVYFYLKQSGFLE